MSIDQVPHSELSGFGTGGMLLLWYSTKVISNVCKAVVWDAAIGLVRWFEYLTTTKGGLFTFDTAQYHTETPSSSHPEQSEYHWIQPTDITPERDFVFSFSLGPKSCWMDLGAGQGFLGIALSLLGCEHVVCTDLEMLRFLVESNIKKNESILSSSHPITFETFDWSVTELPPPLLEIQKSAQPFNLIVVCECLYANVPYQFLLNALLLLTEPPPSVPGFEPPLVLIVYEHRNTLTFHGFMTAAQPYFLIARIPMDLQHPFYQTDDIFYFALKRKPESIGKPFPSLKSVLEDIQSVSSSSAPGESSKADS